MFFAGVISSGISILLLLFSANGEIWHALTFVAFILSVIINWFGWMRDKIKSADTREFYMINGLAWIAYTILALGMMLLVMKGVVGYLVYSLCFSHLRIFEILEDNALLRKTTVSVPLTSLIMLAIMVLCERFSDKNIVTIREIFTRKGGDNVEIKEEKVEATQSNKTVRKLSVAEAVRLEDIDKLEAVEAIRIAAEEMPEKVVDGGISKGRGETVKFVEVRDMDNDLTEGDFNAKAEAEKEFKQNEAYDSSSLWNTDIYEGRTEGGRPVTDFEDDFTTPPPAAHGDWAEDSLWNGNFRNGRDTEEAMDERKNLYEDYSADSLWSIDMKRGRGIDRGAETMDDYIREMTGETNSENINEPYSADSLWDVTPMRDRGDSHRAGTMEDYMREMSGETNSENINEPYSADSLWDTGSLKK